MAAINLPFAASATKRAPTTDELASGYGCGDADITLFDWLAWWQTGQTAAAISKSGLSVDDIDIERLAKAIRSQRLNYLATVGGTANALTITLDPAPASYADLLATPIRFIPGTANSGAATINVNGLGVTAIRKDGTAALAANDLIAGRLVELAFDGTNFQLLTAPVLAFSNRQIFTASGAFTPPAGITRARVRVWGAGGGSGGTFGTASGSSGGGGGGYAEGIVSVTPGVGVTATVGAGGAAGASAGATAGGTGGTSSFASISATGGAGGAGASGVINASSVSSGGTGTGGDLQITGNTSDAPFPISGSNVVVGAGGGAFGGMRAHNGLSGGTSTGGVTGLFPGGGATGSANQADGAPGAGGLIIVEY